MRLGLRVPFFNFPAGNSQIGTDFANIAKRADAAGFYSLWVMDHFFQINHLGPSDDPMLEGYSALSFAAALTKKVKLGTMVTGVTYRWPGILVKTATTLDVLSGGRAYFGVGAAWNEEEHNALGVPFPPLKDRFEILEETLQIANLMWQGDKGSQEPFDGKHNQLARTLNAPQTISKPHPPILIGGTGEQKTLRFVAKYGDACNLFARISDDEMRHKLEVLQGHCADLGRDYADIEKTVVSSYKLTRAGNGRGELSPAAVLQDQHRLAALGIDHNIITLQNVMDPAAIDLMATEVLPAAAQIVAAGRNKPLA